MALDRVARRGAGFLFRRAGVQRPNDHGGAKQRGCPWRNRPAVALSKPSQDFHYLGDWLLSDRRDGGIVRRKAYRNQEERPLVLRPVENARKKSHGARRVSQRCEAAHMKGGQQKPRCDTDRFLYIAVPGFLFSF